MVATLEIATKVVGQPCITNCRTLDRVGSRPVWDRILIQAKMAGVPLGVLSLLVVALLLVLLVGEAG